MKITMNGEYGTRDDPTVKVRVLCIDGSDSHAPVYVDRGFGSVVKRSADGRVLSTGDHSNDLVPLKKKPLELWVNVYDETGFSHTHSTPGMAANSLSANGKGRTVHMIEVIE